MTNETVHVGRGHVPADRAGDISRCVVGVGIGCRNIAAARSVSVVVCFLDKLALRIVFISNQRIVAACALGDHRDISQCVIGVLFALEQRSGAVADIAELDLRGGAVAADRAVGIRENAP